MNKQNEINIQPEVEKVTGNSVYTLSDGQKIRIHLQHERETDPKLFDYFESSLKNHLLNENIHISQEIITQRVNNAVCKYLYAVILEFHPLEAIIFAFEVLLDGYPNTHNVFTYKNPKTLL